MPNRILREGINSSARVNALTQGAELFYRRLMSVVDDFGRFHADPATLRGACWPTCPSRVTEEQVAVWLRECAHSSIKHKALVSVYEVDGAVYLQIVDFKQQTRSKSKFPDPANGLIADCAQNDFNHTSLDVVVFRSSESETNTETVKEKPNAPDGAFSLVPSTRTSKSATHRSIEDTTKALGLERLTWWENFWRVFPCCTKARIGRWTPLSAKLPSETRPFWPFEALKCCMRPRLEPIPL